MKTNNTMMGFQVALMGTGLVQPVDMKGKGSRLEVLCRLVPGQERAWLQVMDGLLLAAEQFVSMDLHVCRRYVRREGQMVFGYHLGIETKTAKLLSAAIDVLVEVLKKAKPDLTPVVAKAPVAPTPAAAVVEPRRAQKKPEIRVVERRVDDEGNEIVVEEMPLPHVNGEMNKPSHKGGRGATRTAASR